MEIRKLMKAEPRIETGVTQFGSDWPGVFLRGDNAFMLANKLRNIIRDHSIDIHNDPELKSIIDLLESCNVNKSHE